MTKNLYICVLFFGIVETKANEIDLASGRTCDSVKIQEVCPNSNVTFWLYTGSEANTPHQLIEDDLLTVVKAPFIPHVPIKVLIHGWTGNKSYHPNIEIRPEYLKMGYNVISVDYGPVAPSPCYFSAVKNCDRVAACIANFIMVLISTPINTRDIYLDDFHVVGFSLGGQVAGRVGTYLSYHENYLTRITALDPAGPLFFGDSSYVSKQSAKFVDAIHTNAGEMGKFLPVGHVDFYVNRIFKQNGCSFFNFSCNHVRAPVYFAESVRSNVSFCGISGPRKLGAIMGEHTTARTRGLYFVETKSRPPYAKPSKQCAARIANVKYT